MQIIWVLVSVLLVLQGRCLHGLDLSHGRISGGDIAAANQFPYQVGLSIEEPNEMFCWCGGSLISEWYLLTAAHCVENAVSITFFLGGVQRLSPRQLIRSTSPKVYLHTDWNTKTYENDIALTRLPEVAIFSSSITPIRLPGLAFRKTSYDYILATTSGWGRTNDDSTAISDNLRYVISYVESNGDCQYSYSNIKSTNICMDTTGGRSTCTGDSGGPLVYRDPDQNTDILIGVTSYGKKTGCTKGYPAVFTRVTSYLDWIQEVSGIVYP